MIGGSLNYEILASLHRPSLPAGLADEVRRLNAEGLTPIDISTALRVGLGQVLEMLNRGEQ